jgi:hypothetical protein
MLEPKRKSGKFTWIPKDQVKDRWGRPAYPPRKPELRKPVFWLARDGDELYFVNNSSETLERVKIDSACFQTTDEGVYMPPDDGGYYYSNVEPDEAVLAKVFDNYYDLDFLHQIQVVIRYSQGKVMLLSPLEKGNIYETILLWDSGEAGKHASMIPIGSI